MAYETGASSDVTDLLSKLRTFATANGWAENFFGARTTGTGTALQINKGGRYVTFKTDTGAGTAQDPGPYMDVYAHDTYNAGNGTEAQANASTVVRSNGMPGPFVAYHFISNTEKGSEYLYCIVETTAGIFKHFGTGTFVKIGAITTAQFVHACRWSYNTSGNTISAQDSSSHAYPFDSADQTGQRNGLATIIRVDADAVTWRWMEGSYTPATNGRGMRGGFRSAVSTSGGGANVMMACAASALTGRNMLWPCFMSAERTGGLYNPLGYPPGVRWVNLTYLAPNDVVTIGTDQWKVFPAIRKNGTLGQVNSGVYGYAYKIN